MAKLAEALALTFLPSTCAICRGALAWSGSRAGVCPACWQGVARHGGPLCPVCGAPEVAEAGPCLACRAAPPPWRAAVSVGPYQGALRELVLLLKGGRRDELARPLGAMMAGASRRAGWRLPATVASVPMTWMRRIRRGYYQAELLGRAVARELERPFVRALRRRGRGAQVGRSRAERLRLPATAFRARRPLAGTVLLVDDVFTTGATASACARALRAAGAEEVLVLTFARTPQTGRVP